jgi:hypothetical protein
MEDEYRKIIPRSYTGPELDSDKKFRERYNIFLRRQQE